MQDNFVTSEQNLVLVQNSCLFAPFSVHLHCLLRVLFWFQGRTSRRVLHAMSWRSVPIGRRTSVGFAWGDFWRDPLFLCVYNVSPFSSYEPVHLRLGWFLNNTFSAFCLSLFLPKIPTVLVCNVSSNTKTLYRAVVLSVAWLPPSSLWHYLPSLLCVFACLSDDLAGNCHGSLEGHAGDTLKECRSSYERNFPPVVTLNLILSHPP